MKPRAIPLILLLSATSAGATDTTTLRFQAPDGSIPLTITAEIAATPAEQKKGLSNRNALAAGKGMIFRFNPPKQRVCMWMKNTHFPLAALFIGKNNNIIKTALMQPNTTTPHCSNGSAMIKYVIEITEEDEKTLPAGSRLLLP